jgi:hypothetical protein
LRLLLDANLSPERIGSALEERGHDVLSLAADTALGALDDPQVLELAAQEDRILVTRNSRDFAPLLREWAEADRHHAGWSRSGPSTITSSPQSPTASHNCFAIVPIPGDGSTSLSRSDPTSRR